MAAAESQQQERDVATFEFVKRNAGLTTVPAKVMALADLEVLDLAFNEIEVVPKGLFPDIAQLKLLDLSHNAIKVLPEDLASLKSLETLHVNNNCLSVLPDGLFSLTLMREINASSNQINCISNRIGNMEGLHVLNLSGNKLRAIPSDIGWLGLKQLNISDNLDLNIPPHVLQCGFKAVMCYLQVIGEQHQLVASHMSAFTARLTELQDRHGLQLGSIEYAAGVSMRLKVAQRLGILSCSHCGLAALPEGLVQQQQQPGFEAVQVVDCSYNTLKAVPTQLLQGMGHLLVLNLSFNSIKTLPAGLGMSALRVLDLSFNKLVSLPSDLGQQLPELQQLYLANNYLTELPNSLQQATGLQDLFLSENFFGGIPQVLHKCKHLAKLSLAACQLTAIDEELDGLSDLRFLDISFNRIKTLPGNMTSLASLAILNLAYNPLGAFPEALCYLTNLRELNLDHSGVTSFPAGLGNLRLLEGLQADGCPLAAPFASLYGKDPLLLVKIHETKPLALNLSEAGLEEVPQQLLQLTQLTSLNLFKNSIKDLPLALGNLRQLQQLTLKGNPLRQPYLKLLDAKGELPLLAFLRPEGNEGTLDISGCGFEALPKELWELQGRSALVNLNLTNNRLRDLPQDMSSLVSLTQVVLDHNLLRHVPNMLLTLPALAVIMASGNSITYLPEGIGQVQQLQALLLHSNQLMQLPDSVTTLTNLRVLGLTSNRLWQLPAGIANCSSLRVLDCSHNLLSRLPAGMGKMSKLRSFKLTHNKLTWLPASDLQELPGLVELHIAGNMFNVDAEMNASDAMSVVQLLAAVAASPAGQAPAQQPTYSRTPSTLYSNANSYSPSIAESIGPYHSARSRLSEPASPTAGALKKGKQQAGSKLSVLWDDHSSIDSNHSSRRSSTAGNTASAVSPGASAIAAAVAAKVSFDDSTVAGHAASSKLPPNAKHNTAQSVPGSIRWSSDGSGFRRSTDGGSAMRRSSEGALKCCIDGARHSLDGAPRPAVHFGNDEGRAANDRDNTMEGYSTSVHSVEDAVPAPGPLGTHRQNTQVPFSQASIALASVSAADTTADTGRHAKQQNASGFAASKLAPAVPAVQPSAETAPTAAQTFAALDAGKQDTEKTHTATEIQQPQPQQREEQAECAAGKPGGDGSPLKVSTPASPLAATAVADVEASCSIADSTTAVVTGSKEAVSSSAAQAHHQAAANDVELAAALPAGNTGAASQLSSWGKIPLMDIPRIIKMLAENPPPPRGQAAAEVISVAGQLLEAPVVRRPQTKARFRRVMQQTQQALALLEKMEQSGGRVHVAAEAGQQRSNTAGQPIS